MKVTKYTTHGGLIYEVGLIDGTLRIISSTSPIANSIIFQDCEVIGEYLYINLAGLVNAGRIVKVEEDDDI